MKSPIIILLFLLVSSCSKKDDDFGDYIYELKVVGDTSASYANVGEFRTIELYILASMTRDNIKLGKEFKININKISIEGNGFIIENEEGQGLNQKVRIKASENLSDTMVRNKLNIFFDDENGLSTSFVVYLYQNPSIISHEYRIESTNPNPYVIPKEGGEFILPFVCKKKTTINGNSKEEPSLLLGLNFESLRVNGAWAQREEMLNTGKVGYYNLKLNAIPYKIDYVPSWIIQIKYGDQIIYKQLINHEQTDDDEFYIGSSSSYRSYPIEI